MRISDWSSDVCSSDLVVLANAVGTGVADDKSIYPYVDEMIRFYLTEEPILKNVPTWQCRKPQDLSHVLANLPDLVVKETDRKSVVSGKSVSVRVDLGGRRIIKKKKKIYRCTKT